MKNIKEYIPSRKKIAAGFGGLLLAGIFVNAVRQKNMDLGDTYEAGKYTCFGNKLEYVQKKSTYNSMFAFSKEKSGQIFDIDNKTKKTFVDTFEETGISNLGIFSRFTSVYDTKKEITDVGQMSEAETTAAQKLCETWRSDTNNYKPRTINSIQLDGGDEGFYSKSSIEVAPELILNK